MDITVLENAGIDYKSGLARFMGNETVYKKCLLMFPDDKSYEKMKEAITSGNIKEAFNTAHTLKGVAGNLSMTRLYEHTVPLVEKLRGGDMSDIDAMLSDVDKDYSDVVKALKSI